MGVCRVSVQVLKRRRVKMQFFSGAFKLLIVVGRQRRSKTRLTDEMRARGEKRRDAIQGVANYTRVRTMEARQE